MYLKLRFVAGVTTYDLQGTTRPRRAAVVGVHDSTSQIEFKLNPKKYLGDSDHVLDRESERVRHHHLEEWDGRRSRVGITASVSLSLVFHPWGAGEAVALCPEPRLRATQPKSQRDMSRFGTR